MTKDFMSILIGSNTQNYAWFIKEIHLLQIQIQEDNLPKNACLQGLKAFCVKVSDITKFTEISKRTCIQKGRETRKYTVIYKG